MADWCLMQPEVSVLYGSSTNLVTWRHVPDLVILNVPGDMIVTVNEFLEFLNREKELAYFVRDSTKDGIFTLPPNRILVKLGDGLPDEEMKRHFTREDFEWRNVYDWRGGNDDSDQVKAQCRAFFKKYGILTKKEFENAFGLSKL